MRRTTFPISAGFVLAVAGMASLTLALEPSVCNPEPWQDEIAAFEAADAASPPPRGAILFVGSSSIRLWDLAKWLPDAATINRGFGGSQICDATHFADVLVVKHQPRLIVFYSGDNDVASGKSAEQVHVDFRAFVAKVRISLPETPIVVIAIKPSIARWKLRAVMREANALIAADCDADDTLQFVDVWPAMLGANGEPRPEIFRDDGLHLNDAGYKLWVDLLRPALVER